MQGENKNYTKEVGVAFDVGTTTIAGAAVDMAQGRIISASTLPNPQTRWGRDVLARINSVMEEPVLLHELKNSVIGACNAIIREVASGRRIKEVTAAGNSVMEHLFLGISPEPLARVPYRPAFKEARRLLAKEAGLDAGEAGLYTFPLIGGFVGGDAVAVLLFLGMQRESPTTLAVDIGTNSEILLSCRGTVYATSAAAGPAFEAGGLKYGMTAGKGAIQGVSIEADEARIEVIGEGSPTGICGSGLVDAAAAFLRAGVIERSGRIKDRSEITTNLSNRVREGADGNSIILYRSAKGEVALTQPDIRALQAAKSAIKAGISVLIKKAGILHGDIERVYIAGAFGSNLRKESLGAIGLFHESWLDRVYPVGDAALEGAALALDDGRKKEAETIAREVKYVSLSGSALFEREFIRNMDFVFTE